MEVHETYRGFDVEVGQAEHIEDPREDGYDGGLITKIFCFHRNYNIGDKHNYNSGDYEDWDGFLDQIKKDYNVLFPQLIRMYDHSSIGISLDASSYPYNCQWDSGWIGWIFIDLDLAKKEMNWKRLNTERKAQLLKYLQAEFQYYAAYVGDEFVDVHIPGMGLYEGPFELNDNYLEHARNLIDDYILEQQKNHYKKLKGWIKNKVAFNFREPLLIEGMNT